MSGGGITFDGVSKRYDQVDALIGVDITIQRGEVCTVVGPNGAGKSTLVAILLGLLHPDAGSVRVMGGDPARPGIRARIGAALQETAVYPSLSTKENLQFFGELAGLRRRALDTAIAEVTAVFGLGDLLESTVQSLSGGERRRVHAAGAVLHRPPVLVLDEPLTGVDAEHRHSILGHVRHLAAEGAAVLFSTHYMAEVDVLGGGVALLDRGRLLAFGSTADLVAAHGAPVIELRFRGAPPKLRGAKAVDGSPGLLRLPSRQPASDVVRLLERLDGHRRDLQSVEVVQPSLEAVFLAIAGRRFESDTEHGIGATRG